MTKYELNKRLAGLLGYSEASENRRWMYKLDTPYGEEFPDSCVVVTGDDNFDIALDYCNNWSQLMPLALAHGIMLSEDNWDSEGKCVGYIAADRWLECSEDKDPAIAIVKCLIAKLEGDNE